MLDGVIATITYILASLFAIAGMGAAGVLIPNYITLGLAIRQAIILGLTQNIGELTIATTLNHKKELVEWRKVAVVAGSAAPLIPLGYLTHKIVSHLIVLVTFETFLIYALYNMNKKSKEHKNNRASTPVLAVLGAIEGYLAGFIGMDAAPIALLAYASVYNDPKKISANTAATALIVSTIAWILYSIDGKDIGIGLVLIAAVLLSGILGGITGAVPMHKISKHKVKIIIESILLLAIIEILAKIIAIAV